MANNYVIFRNNLSNCSEYNYIKATGQAIQCATSTTKTTAMSTTFPKSVELQSVSDIAGAVPCMFTATLSLSDSGEMTR